MVIAYDGGNYLGWQKTKMGPSIEGTLEALFKTPLQAASRTDAGVHAQGQVVNFFSDQPTELTSLNALLPNDISILSIDRTHDSFHPTIDCIGKEYHYFVCTGVVQEPRFRSSSWHHPRTLNYELMQEAANKLIGTHDYSAFCNAQENETNTTPIRVVNQIDITPLPNNRYHFKVVGNHFLYKMVRNLVGTIVQVGEGKLPHSEVSEILESLDRKRAGITAPAHGLTLAHVFY